MILLITQIILNSSLVYSNYKLSIDNKPVYYDSANDVYICNEKTDKDFIVDIYTGKNINKILIGNKDQGYIYKVDCINNNYNKIHLKQNEYPKIFNSINNKGIINLYPVHYLNDGYVNYDPIKIIWCNDNQMKEIKKKVSEITSNKVNIFKNIKLLMLNGKYYLKINFQYMDEIGIMVSKGNDKFYYKLGNIKKGLVEPIITPYGKGLYKLTVTFFVSFFKVPISIDIPFFQKTDSIDKVDKYLLETEDIKVHNCLITQAIAQIILCNDDDYTRAFKIYNWITSNIAYDTSTIEGHEIEEQSYYSIGTLVNSKGVCEGYANLFSSLCRAGGIPCKTVYGKLREGTNWIDHAWNSVYINKRWINVDSTFGAGYIKDNKFIKHPSTKYFNMSDNEFFMTRTKCSEE